uniref:Uncharacterized protein n=1 Tax=Eutreptiella gymnastica TaxID=73025 RepID=A0A7S4FQK1_9EUGL
MCPAQNTCPTALRSPKVDRIEDNCHCDHRHGCRLSVLDPQKGRHLSCGHGQLRKFVMLWSSGVLDGVMRDGLQRLSRDADGEQMTIADEDGCAMKIGARAKIGDSVLLEVTYKASCTMQIGETDAAGVGSGCGCGWGWGWDCG